MKAKIVLWWALLAPLITAPAVANPSSKKDLEKVSPARDIDFKSNKRHRGERDKNHVRRKKYRSIDGSHNNRRDAEMGAAHTPLNRRVSSDYSDGIASLAGENRKSAREISNIVAAQDDSITNPLNASDYLWQWGQFLDHDIDLTEGVSPPEPENIQVPADDQYFIASSQISFNRSIYDLTTGINTPRQQLNEITTWIDASNVYGSSEDRALALRMLDGSGQLKTSEGDLLPFNTLNLPNAGGSDPTLFLAGDVRANEQSGLTAMHTLFVREHNRLARQLARRHPRWSGDQIYEKARQLVGGMMQVITYKEFLPALLGSKALSRYRGYKPSVNGRIDNIFSTAAYRFGHSALSPTIMRVDEDGDEISYGHLQLRDAFFNPHRIIHEGGIDPILRGLARQHCQNIDPFVIDDVRNFLFGPPEAGGFDLAALNIQRGRDHGLPSYNQTRMEMDLEPASSFSDISSDPEIQARLANAYENVDDIDVWVGGLSEDQLPGAHVGELFFSIIKQQFEVLRDGDRYWYQRTLRGRELRMVERTRLSKVIRRNTDIGKELKNNVFIVD